MSFGISINIATAAMEGIYERLCWICITVKNTLVYDQVGNHATFRERADESVRCSGFWAKLLHADRPTGLGQGSQ